MKTLLAALLGCLLAAPAFAVPVVRYTWGPADGTVSRQDWAGPATYTQTLSITGLQGTVSQLNVSIADGPWTSSPSDAWKMLFPEPFFTPLPAPRPDCTGAPGLTVQPVVASATAIPGSTLNTVLYTSVDVGSPAPPRGSIQIALTINPPLVADPAVRYGIATLEYHLENAEPGAGSPALCDNALNGICWVGLYASATGNSTPVWEHETLTWQRTEDYCLFAVTPVRTSTWGSIKQIYR